MGVSKEQLQAILSGKARDLCSPQGDALINEASRRRNNLIDEDPANYDGDAEFFDSLYTNEVPSRKKKVSDRDIQYSEYGAANSRMDENIKKSLMENPIDRSGMYGDGGSVLDGMDIPKRKPQPRQTMNEQYSPAPQAIGVDYSIIKAIVNECLNEYFSKQQLNESATLKTIGLKAGSIKLVDNKGNVYSAKLEKLGNTNDTK